MRKALLFDFDGVLVDSFKISYDASVISNSAAMSLKFYRALFDGNIHKSLKRSGLHKSQKIDFYSIYGPKLAKLPLAPGAAGILKKLARNYLLIIISSTPKIHIENFFKRHKAIQYFAEILGADFHTSKVSKIKYALKKYRLKPSDCLFVTDTLGDMLEAKKCGVKSIAVQGGFHLLPALKRGKPLKILTGLGRLPGAALEYFQRS